MMTYIFFSRSYMNDWNKLNETRLPPIEAFYNYLAKEPLAPDLYEHGQRVWNELGFRSMREFCSVYLTLDVLLLGTWFQYFVNRMRLEMKRYTKISFFSADVFQDFRELSLREYELAPENFHSLPGLSLSAALKLTGVELELISDPNLYLWFESMIRGKIP